MLPPSSLYFTSSHSTFFCCFLFCLICYKLFELIVQFSFTPSIIINIRQHKILSDWKHVWRFFSMFFFNVVVLIYDYCRHAQSLVFFCFFSYLSCRFTFLVCWCCCFCCCCCWKHPKRTIYTTIHIGRLKKNQKIVKHR